MYVPTAITVVAARVAMKRGARAVAARRGRESGVVGLAAAGPALSRRYKAPGRALGTTAPTGGWRKGGRRRREHSPAPATPAAAAASTAWRRAGDTPTTTSTPAPTVRVGSGEARGWVVGALALAGEVAIEEALDGRALRRHLGLAFLSVVHLCCHGCRQCVCV